MDAWTLLLADRMTTQNHYIKQQITMQKDSPILQPINVLQEAHPWLVEREARHLLVGVYAALTNAYGLTGAELREQMDLALQGLVATSRKELEQLIQATGGPVL